MLLAKAASSDAGSRGPSNLTCFCSRNGNSHDKMAITIRRRGVRVINHDDDDDVVDDDDDDEHSDDISKDASSSSGKSGIVYIDAGVTDDYFCKPTGQL